MQYNDIRVEQIAERVRQDMSGVCPAHDFFHIERVVCLAQILHTREGKGEIMVIELAALLHEALDEKFFAEDLGCRKKAIREILVSCNIEEVTIDSVLYIIEHIGYGKSLGRPVDFVYTAEFMIVEDADRLESIGAIAMARTFAYGGKKGRSIYNPACAPDEKLNTTTYITAKNPSINHFYEKLLLLKDLLHTESARAIAKDRHVFMEDFLKQFYKEWDVEV